jgi:hypothetical protein
MPVRSNSRSSFIYKNRRYSSIEAAEAIMLAESPVHSRLVQTERSVGDLGVEYRYEIPVEPYLNAGQDETLICGLSLPLQATITGVPIENLDVLWEQVSGNLVNISSPTEEDTVVLKDSGDNTDKVFSVRTVNRQTGVINSDRVTVYGTPTERVFFDGTGFGVSYLHAQHTGTIDVSSIDTSIPLNQDSFQSSNIQRAMTWSSIGDPQYLSRVELLENYNGTYQIVGTASPSEKYIEMPPYKNVKTAYKIRFVYDYNSVEETIYSDVKYIESPVKAIIAHDRFSRYSGSMGILGSTTTRTVIDSQSPQDSARLALHGSTISSNIGATQRTTRREEIETEILELAMHGSTMTYSSTTARAIKGNIGGG